MLTQRYKPRFECYDISGTNTRQKYQALLKEITIKQRLGKICFVVVDSLNKVVKRRGNFVDTDALYECEYPIREGGGTVLILHHTNKSKVIGDSQQISDYADFVLKCTNDPQQSIISIKSEKNSRFQITNRAYEYNGKKIVTEIPYDDIRVMDEVTKSVFVLAVKLLKESTSLKQGELVDMIYEDESVKAGKSRVRQILKNLAKNGFLEHKQECGEGNAIYYFLKGGER